ncbi:MAG TPA: hypothetical protein DCL44_08960 [Elusimicrobia bacterium]|nr:hypothetical protein [Elusimicrobiota bacterium]
MKDDEKAIKLVSLLAVRRSDAFWARQRAQIMAAATEKHSLTRAWFLAPAAAMVALMVFVLARGPWLPHMEEQQMVSTAFIESLDLLEDLDVLEAVSEEEL